MSNSFESIHNNNLLLKLNPVSLRSLISLKVLPCNLYAQESYKFIIISRAGDSFSRDHAKQFFLKGYRYFFIHEDEQPKYIEAHRNELLKTTRSLSVGDSATKLQYKIELLNKGLRLLYVNPIDDELLQQQQRSVSNLSQFLLNEKGTIKKLYNSQKMTPEQFLYQQPINSSILLLGMLKFIKVFNSNDIHNLFMTSYLKDIGMSLIPHQLEDKEYLTDSERIILNKHAAHSSEILSGRINLDNNYLRIIENHHAITQNQDDPQISVGIESVLINVIDIFVAMTSPRPYRQAETPYVALEKIKSLMVPQYSLEFKYLVHFLNKMLK